jgi:hypothetical protein
LLGSLARPLVLVVEPVTKFSPIPAPFDPLYGADCQPGQTRTLPGWPRLMNQRLAAAYLSIGTTLLRDLLPPKKIRGRSVWDRRDLDRIADALEGQPLDGQDAQSHSRDVERRWFEKRAKEGKGNG